jgi:hypothetical protein
MLANNVNDEGANLKVMTITLKVVCYESLGLEDPFQGTCMWACMTFLSNLHKQIFKSVTHGLKSLGKANKNGQRLTLMWVCNHINSPLL